MSQAAAVALYAIFAVGAVGVYFLMPRPGRSKTVAGAIFGLAALAGLVVLLAAGLGLTDSNAFFFYLFGGIAIAAAARTVTHPKPVYCALYFVLVIVSVAALMVLLSAEFLAVALIIIYAGAILVTYAFMLMLTQQAGAPTYDRTAREPFLSVLAGFVLMAAVAARAGDLPDRAQPRTLTAAAETQPGGAGMLEPLSGNTADIGWAVMTQYVVALEVSGVLLLIAMVGAIGLSRKRVPSEVVRPPRELGKIGTEVEPF